MEKAMHPESRGETPAGKGYGGGLWIPWRRLRTHWDANMYTETESIGWRLADS